MGAPIVQPKHCGRLRRANCPKWEFGVWISCGVVGGGLRDGCEDGPRRDRKLQNRPHGSQASDEKLSKPAGLYFGAGAAVILNGNANAIAHCVGSGNDGSDAVEESQPRIGDILIQTAVLS